MVKNGNNVEMGTFGELPSSYLSIAVSLVSRPNGYNSSNVIPKTAGINTINTISTGCLRISAAYSAQLGDKSLIH